MPDHNVWDASANGIVGTNLVSPKACDQNGVSLPVTDLWYPIVSTRLAKTTMPYASLAHNCLNAPKAFEPGAGEEKPRWLINKDATDGPLFLPETADSSTIPDQLRFNNAEACEAAQVSDVSDLTNAANVLIGGADSAKLDCFATYTDLFAATPQWMRGGWVDLRRRSNDSPPDKLMIIVLHGHWAEVTSRERVVIVMSQSHTVAFDDSYLASRDASIWDWGGRALSVPDHFLDGDHLRRIQKLNAECTDAQDVDMLGKFVFDAEVDVNNARDLNRFNSPVKNQILCQPDNVAWAGDRTWEKANLPSWMWTNLARQELAYPDGDAIITQGGGSYTFNLVAKLRPPTSPNAYRWGGLLNPGQCINGGDPGNFNWMLHRQNVGERFNGAYNLVVQQECCGAGNLADPRGLGCAGAVFKKYAVDDTACGGSVVESYHMLSNVMPDYFMSWGALPE